MNPIDLESFNTTTACDKGFTVELKHPATGEPIGVSWTILGPDSAAMLLFKKRRSNSYFEKYRKDHKTSEPALDADTIEQSTIDYLVECSTGWKTGKDATLTMAGEVLSFSKENARTVLTKYVWIRRQLDEAASDISNFMQSK